MRNWNTIKGIRYDSIIISIRFQRAHPFQYLKDCGSTHNPQFHHSRIIHQNVQPMDSNVVWHRKLSDKHWLTNCCSCNHPRLETCLKWCRDFWLCQEIVKRYGKWHSSCSCDCSWFVGDSMVLSQSCIANYPSLSMSINWAFMSSSLFQIVLSDNGNPFCFAAYSVPKTVSHILTAEGRIKSSAIIITVNL